MLAILNGQRGGLLKIARGTDVILNGILTDDNGAEFDATAQTLTLELYEKRDRSDTPTSIAAALATAAAGTFTITIGDATLPVATFAAGDHYAWIKRDDSGDIELSKEFTILRLG